MGKHPKISTEEAARRLEQAETDRAKSAREDDPPVPNSKMSEEGRRSNYITWGVGLMTIFLAWLGGKLVGNAEASLVVSAGLLGIGLLLRGHFPVWFRKHAFAWYVVAIISLVGAVTPWVKINRAKVGAIAPACHDGICAPWPIAPKILDFDTLGIRGGDSGDPEALWGAPANKDYDGPLAANPGQVVFFSVDKDFPNAAFLIFCDQACQATTAKVFGIMYYTFQPMLTDKPTIVMVRIGTPVPLPARTRIEVTVRSKGNNGIKVLHVDGYVPPSQ